METRKEAISAKEASLKKKAEREAFERKWKQSQAEDLYRTFTRLYPDSFKALVPVYNHQVGDIRMRETLLRSADLLDLMPTSQP